MHILIATDGSAHSDVAVSLGAQIARATNSTPTVLTVIRLKADQVEADAVLARASWLMVSDAANVQSKTRTGNVAEEIVCEATEGNYDLTILGMRPRHNLLECIQGTTVRQVLARAPCQVIIAKGKAALPQRILVCESGAEGTSVLDRFMERTGELLTPKGEVTILHVMSQISSRPGIPGWQLRANAEELMGARVPEGDLLRREILALQQPRPVPHPKVRHGLVVDEIAAESQEGDYDLVVIGAPRSEGWQSLLLDNLAYQIIDHVDRPILITQRMPADARLTSRPLSPVRRRGVADKGSVDRRKSCIGR